MKKLKRIIIINLCIMIPLIIISSVDNYFSERTNEYLEHAVKYSCSDIFSLCSMIVKDEDAKNLIIYKYNDESDITGIYIDTHIVNRLLSEVSLVISNSLNSGVIDERLGVVEISLGQLISKSVFASFGPRIRVKTSPMTSYTTDLVVESSSIGINTTKVDIYIKAIINVEAFIPLVSTSISLDTNIYLVSELVNGDIPIQYFRGSMDI